MNSRDQGTEAARCAGPSGRLSATVVVPTFGRRFHEIACALAGVLDQSAHDYEVVVVDQNDTADPALADYAAKNGPRLRVVRISEKGLPNARNVGTAHARGDIIIFCDDDVAVGQGFVSAHIACYSDSAVAGVAGRVVDGGVSGRSDPDAWRPLLQSLVAGAGADGGSVSAAAARVGAFRRWDADFTAGYSSAARCFVDSAFGCNMSFRKTALERVGGFSESFGGTAHLEESDLCLRIGKLGGRIVFEPAALLVHLKGTGGGCRARSAARWAYWYGHNYLLLFLRHFERRFLPVFLAARLLRFLKFAFEFHDLAPFLEGIKGLLDGARTHYKHAYRRHN
ncbi:MAG: glycosyltransferase family 2 protein [Planctomycetota bacterium]|nr:glycosyltransferase family 2 protein [Planctomycetota bacterium]